MITEILKEKTSFEHLSLEEKMHADRIMDGSFTRADYERMLELNYRFLQNFEDEVFGLIHPETAQKISLEKRRKFSHIQKDAEQIGLNVSEEIAHEKITNAQQALGVLYVMEGATLGGNVIERHLKKNPEFEGATFHFFGIYGDETGTMWQNFKHVLNTEITSESDKEQCLLGAELAYTYLLSLSV